MKIRVTEIEADANELRACNTVVDGIVSMLRNVFSPGVPKEQEEERDDDRNI